MHKKYTSIIVLLIAACLLANPVYAADTTPVEESLDEASVDDTTPIKDELAEESVTEAAAETKENGESDTEEAEEIEEIEEDIVLPEVTPIVPTPTPIVGTNVDNTDRNSTISDKKWDITGKGYKDATYHSKVYIANGINRFEVFYNTSGGDPNLIFKSPTGAISFQTNNYVEYGEKKYVIRPNNYIANYPDISYMVIYIDGTSEPGDWDMGVSINKATTEFMVLTSSVPDNWENLAQEYKTHVKTMVVWAIDKEKSNYTAANLSDIYSMDKDIPDSNLITPLGPDDINPPKESNPLIGLIALIIIAIIGGIAGVVLLFKKLTRETEENKKLAIKTANARVKKKKKLENDSLDKVMEHYDDEYADEDDIEGYLMMGDDYKDDGETVSSATDPDEEGQKTGVDFDKLNAALDKENDYSVPKTDNSVESNDSYPIPVPEWKRPQVAAGAKTPSWMIDDEDDDDVFF